MLFRVFVKIKMWEKFLKKLFSVKVFDILYHIQILYLYIECFRNPFMTLCFETHGNMCDNWMVKVIFIRLLELVYKFIFR